MTTGVELERDKLQLALLYVVLYFIEVDGEDAVSWWTEEMSTTDLFFRLYEQYGFQKVYDVLVCTLRYI